jgi:hypothetical protein
MITIKFKYRSGGSQIIDTVSFTKDEDGHKAHYVLDSDRGVYTVYLIDQEGYFVREYVTQ